MITSTDAVARLDPHVRALLRELEAIWDDLAGSASETVLSLEAPAADSGGWTELDELQNQTDIWPKRGGGTDVAVFYRFRVFQRDDGVRIGLGYRERDDGTSEVGVFLLGPLDKKRLIVYFQPTEDFATSGKMFAPIRGKSGGRSYFRGVEALPPDYAGKDVIHLWEVSPKHRLREIWVVLASADDWETMVEHGAAQMRIRNLTV